MMQALAEEDNVSFLLAPSCCLILLIAVVLAIRDKLQTVRKCWRGNLDIFHSQMF